MYKMEADMINTYFLPPDMSRVLDQNDTFQVKAMHEVVTWENSVPEGSETLAHVVSVPYKSEEGFPQVERDRNEMAAPGHGGERTRSVPTFAHYVEAPPPSLGHGSHQSDHENQQHWMRLGRSLSPWSLSMRQTGDQACGGESSDSLSGASLDGHAQEWGRGHDQSTVDAAQAQQGPEAYGLSEEELQLLLVAAGLSQGPPSPVAAGRQMGGEEARDLGAAPIPEWGVEGGGPWAASDTEEDAMGSPKTKKGKGGTGRTRGRRRAGRRSGPWQSGACVQCHCRPVLCRALCSGCYQRWHKRQKLAREQGLPPVPCPSIGILGHSYAQRVKGRSVHEAMEALQADGIGHTKDLPPMQQGPSSVA